MQARAQDALVSRSLFLYLIKILNSQHFEDKLRHERYLNSSNRFSDCYGCQIRCLIHLLCCKTAARGVGELREPPLDGHLIEDCFLASTKAWNRHEIQRVLNLFANRCPFSKA